ncbi:POLO box duplicated region [Synechococcus sp. J7-Johnson]|uniref:DUF6816 family protein n=1 Tax=Synechococcus sp. J7-Johnson TaxID=2823737 RepID=UPI0020CBBB10|nr:POLO box duplicated region [Synechococcus sp. J7-Johnson]MCP9841296.1 POLO box duplicated region [Synechococcus sp. J7-Johnson]
MLSSRIAFILAALIALWPGQAMVANSGPGPLERRLVAWPEWSLPAPLSRPGRSDLRYPDWFAGAWWVHSLEEGSSAPIPPYAVRFLMDHRGAVVGDRAFNATQVGDALLGGQLLSVANDPANPNRQLALLRGDLELESTVIGRRSQGGSEAVALGESFLSDELALQVLHGPGGARISRVETLSRYRLVDSTPGHELIRAEQWQASYPSPEQGLVAHAGDSHHLWLLLSRNP